LFLFGPIRASVGPRAQTKGVFPTVVEDAGVPKVEQNGEQVIGLVKVVAARMAVERNFGIGKNAPSIPCRHGAAVARPWTRTLIDLPGHQDVMDCKHRIAAESCPEA